MAFTALLEGPSEAKVTKLIFAALSEFVKLLKDKNDKVKESSAKALSKIGELYPQCFLTNQNLLTDLEIIVLSL